MKLTIFILISSLIVLSCEDFVTIPSPTTQLTTPSVFSNDESALSAMRGVYSTLLTQSGFSSGSAGSISHLLGLSADEFDNYNSAYANFSENDLQANTAFVKTALWDPAYQTIYYSNSIIEGISTSTGINDTLKNQMRGEALFLRAFCHFYLVNAFGDIPLITTTDYRKNNNIVRTPSEQVYQQIINDLKEAKTLLTADYSWFSQERVRPTKWVATALLSRTYLYKKDWIKAESEASEIINNKSLYELEGDLNNVFLKNSREAIWQLKPAQTTENTNEAKVYIPSESATTTPGNVDIKAELINSFEADDKRFENWTTEFTSTSNEVYFIPYKYKVSLDGLPQTEYYIVFRLAEQYLIRAEARMRLENLPLALEDLNVIRMRAGLEKSTSSTIDDLFIEIKQERRKEFFSEWGHRWLDLKRWDLADATIKVIKPLNWQATDQLYPIPDSERKNNINLGQNPGY